MTLTILNKCALIIERTVSQLNLDDFVPEFNREEIRLEETNPNLRPEVRDELSFSYEKQWSNNTGSITFTPYYHKITDLITEVPLAVRSGDGNVDNAKEYGLNVDTYFGLESIGIENTLISASFTWRDSQMDQPFTGEDVNIERLSNNKWDVKITQSEVMPGVSFSLRLRNKSPHQFSRFDYQGRLDNEMTANAFIDYQISKSLKLRLNGNHLLKRKSSYRRTRYTGLFTETEMLRLENRTYEREPRFAMTLSGQF